MPLVSFDMKSAVRIAAAVKKIEGIDQPQPRPGRSRRTPPTFARGVLDTALNQGSSATMSVWRRSGSTQTDTGDNITVYDWLLPSGQSVASGSKVVAAFCADTDEPRWYVIAAGCS